jgi:hypothetical protein
MRAPKSPDLVLLDATLRVAATPREKNLARNLPHRADRDSLPFAERVMVARPLARGPALPDPGRPLSPDSSARRTFEARIPG